MENYQQVVALLMNNHLASNNEREQPLDWAYDIKGEDKSETVPLSTGHLQLV